MRVKVHQATSPWPVHARDNMGDFICDGAHLYQRDAGLSALPFDLVSDQLDSADLSFNRIVSLQG